MLRFVLQEDNKMNKYYSCECCGGGSLKDLKKEIYEQSGGSYSDDFSFSGNKRFFKCTECGKVWWTNPLSEFMHYVDINSQTFKLLRLTNIENTGTALKTG
jgi:uncharacterized protein with PIN domain